MEYPKPIMGATELRQMGFPRSVVDRAGPDQKARDFAGEVTENRRVHFCLIQKDLKMAAVTGKIAGTGSARGKKKKVKVMKTMGRHRCTL